MTSENNEKRFVKPAYVDLLNSPDFFHQVKVKGDKKTLVIDKGGHAILSCVSTDKKKPITTVIHCMIGQSVKCWEEQHEFVINSLLDEVIALRHICNLYRERYGKLPVVKKSS